MSFGGFYNDPNVWVNTPWPVPQGPINHALPATSALAERFNNALGELSNRRKRVDQ
jgi:hypothetical protein